MSWNPVLNKFIEIKNEYKRKFGEVSYSYIDGYTDESQTCLERWVEQPNWNIQATRMCIILS